MKKKPFFERQLFTTINIIVFITVVVNLCLILAIFLLQDYLPPTIPLWYGKPQGVDQLATVKMLIIPPFFSLAITVFNLFFVKLTQDVFLKKVLYGLAFVSTVLASITVVKIILLVGNI